MRRVLVVVAAALALGGCGTPQRFASSCEPAYRDICIYRVDESVTCKDITSSHFRVTTDPYGLDANGDGIACGPGDA